ncbi:MAG: 6-phosphofructokinase [Anaerolineaceae bacterium]|nr:6-phosphofructokinase [Anaerolineaceae bacterium]
MNKKKIMKIGVLTSGGDSPGMNPCIRAVVRTAASNDIQVMGIEAGFAGLIRGNFIPLGPRDVGGILGRGGTFLQTARSLEFREPKGQREAIRQMNSAGIDGLIVIGGDGSLNGAHKLGLQGIPVIGVPASIDNDIFGTDMCIGVDTALNTILDAIDKLRDTASSHNRAFLIEIMGRSCGYLTLRAGMISGAELALIPEQPIPLEDVISTVENAYLRGKEHCIIAVAEGYSPSSTEIAEKINEMNIGFDTRVTILGHIQRGGSPTAFDRWLATRFGVSAVEFLLAGKTDIMTALVGHDIESIELEEVISKQRIIPPYYIELASKLAK